MKGRGRRVRRDWSGPSLPEKAGRVGGEQRALRDNPSFGIPSCGGTDCMYGPLLRGLTKSHRYLLIPNYFKVVFGLGSLCVRTTTYRVGW